MTTEKTGALLSEKIPFSNEQKQGKTCSKRTLCWLLGVLLVTLFLIIVVQFLYPSLEERFRPEVENIHIFQEQPFEAIPPPVMTDFLSEQKYKKSSSKPWDLKFLVDPSHLCATRYPPDSEQYLQDPEVKLLILVPSATGHFVQRAAIRSTWGSVTKKLFSPMRLGFVLGTTTNKSEENLIEKESSEYSDIIQVDCVDSYSNLTTKSVLMLKWVTRRCPHAKYFLKADDDTFVNVGIIVDMLQKEPFISNDKFIGGYIHKEAQPTRLPGEKYYVSVEDYPFEAFPPFASGTAYVTTGPTAAQLFEVSKQVQPFLTMEDVFVTGLCSQQIDATLLHDPRFKIESPPSPPSWESFGQLATANSVTPDTLLLVWDDMNRFVFDHLYELQKAINATIVSRKEGVASF